MKRSRTDAGFHSSGIQAHFDRLVESRLILARKDTDASFAIPEHEQTPEGCLAAVLRHVESFCFVNTQTEAVCLVLVQHDGLALRLVRKQTPTLCLAAVRQNGAALQYVHKQTSMLCVVADRQLRYALPPVHEEAIPPTVQGRPSGEWVCSIQFVKKPHCRVVWSS
ncbi:unnamed protein product [marine sediment metagenome]|uniref:DUF4116 domain-containing protein n=1 Tax=marine sediment metagenome TaxID=412755 RepID=X1C4N8_9ZZZZ